MKKDLLLRTFIIMYINYNYTHTAGMLHANTFTYTLVRILGLSLIASGVYCFINYKPSTSRVGDDFLRVLNLGYIVLGVQHLFPQYTGLFKQAAYLRINNDEITWNLNKEPTTIKLNSIKKINMLFGSTQLVLIDGSSSLIETHFISNQDKFEEYNRVISSISKTKMLS